MAIKMLLVSGVVATLNKSRQHKKGQNQSSFLEKNEKKKKKKKKYQTIPENENATPPRHHHNHNHRGQR